MDVTVKAGSRDVVSFFFVFFCLFLSWVFNFMFFRLVILVSALYLVDVREGHVVRMRLIDIIYHVASSGDRCELFVVFVPRDAI